MLYHKTIPIEHIHSCLRIVQAACEGEITYDLAERKRKEDIMGKKKQMRSEVKGNVKNSIGRIAFAALAVLLQIGWILILMIKLYQYSSVISLLTSLFALVVALRIYGKHTNAAFKMPWIIVILAFPVFGLCIYGLFGHKEAMHKIIRKFEDVDAQLIPLNVQDETILQQLEQEDPLLANQCHYIWKYGNYPVYDTTAVKFYPEAYLGYEEQLKELEKAKHFIFLEYHAIEEAEAFARLKDVLARKAAEGVEVRILYDDVGCIGFLDKSFIDRMNAIGVQCRVFNYVVPFLNIFMNNRDHRKIMVIDGKVGFTGGYNLADEYFNITHPYGYWKDTGILLRGEGTANMTSLFLQMWEYVTGEKITAFKSYLPTVKLPQDGWVQPFADSPLDDLNIGESTYLQIIHNARKYVYITTPYLVLDNEMITALTIAAQSGVDVRILTPGIPDKKLVYMITRSYYQQLHRAGVKIYEYRPGFLHAKSIVSDDDTAVVGTINMDFRSFFLHFECATCFYNSSVVAAVKQDILETINVSRRIDDAWLRRVPWLRSIAASVLRLFAPLL